MTADERRRRADAADALCAAAFARAVPDGADGADGVAADGPPGIALVAVGGYGRRELAPHSDLDVVLLHADGVDDAEVGEVAAQVWYPLWDAGASVDHAVRAFSEVALAAKQDLRVALGLLDARHLAGDPALTLQLRTSFLAGWRRDARERLPQLRDLVASRGARLGELGHVAVPDLKESAGGLRDATVLRALVATWLVDVPHADLERCRQQLLDVRDALHAVAGRGTDRVAPELWADLAARLGLPDAGSAQRHVRGLGRRTTHLSRLTWRRVEGVLARPGPGRRSSRHRGPALTPVAPMLAELNGEVVLDRGADPARRPDLLLRAAAEAAERNMVLAPPTAARLARDCQALPEPWPTEAREHLVRLLAAGPGLLPVWETLDETGGLDRLLPEWERIRLLPHASEVHRFTVDRHSVETCIAAAASIRRVDRPDLLALAALLHDIGKGGLVEHSVAGAPVAAAVAARLGLPDADVAVVAALVRWHLLLSTVATTRDLEDPATVASVAEQVGDRRVLDLLEVLTEADARATSPQAWTPWRAGLVADLVQRARAALGDGTGGRGARYDVAADEPPPGDRPPAAAAIAEGRADVLVEPAAHGSRVTVTARDQVGLLAAVAGTLALQRVPVRAARAWTAEDVATSVWDVDAPAADPALDPALLRQRLESVLAGEVRPGARLRRTSRSGLPPSVDVHPEASRRATVLEVRDEDRPGLVHWVCAALAGAGLSVRSAHVSTVGPQAVDVFYVQEPGAGALTDDRAAAAAHAVRDALDGTVTLDD